MENKQFTVWDRSHRWCLFCNSSQQKVIKICVIQVVRQPLRVSLPLFWFKASSRTFSQITKNPNYSSTCLSGRYVTDATNLTEKYDSEGYIDFPVAKFGVYHNHKPEKVNSTTSVTIRISRVTDKYLGNDTDCLSQKNANSRECQGVYSQPTT